MAENDNSPIVATQTTTPTEVETSKVVEPKVEEAPKDDNPEAGKADPLLDGYYRENPFFYEVAEYFNLESKDYDMAAPKLSVIVDWIVKKFDVHKPEDILMKLREGEDMVQKPGWDEKRYTNLYKYARLEQQELAIKKAKSAFERNPNG